MTNSYFFEDIQILEEAGSYIKRETLFIKKGVIKDKKIVGKVIDCGLIN